MKSLPSRICSGCRARAVLDREARIRVLCRRRDVLAAQDRWEFCFSAAKTRISLPGTDHNLAIAIARQLGNSVEKVLLYEETARAYDNLRNTQEQLLQSEKMSAVGQLISGVAHELNNPLTAILGYAQLLETEPIGERAQDYVRKLYQQTQRTHRVVQNLLSFSRQRKPIQSQVDLRRVLEDTLALREFDLKLNNIR